MTTPSLKELQRVLAADILANARGATAANTAAQLGLRLPPAIEAEERLAIYRDGYPARVLEALEESYPAVANILGDGSFANLTRRYLATISLASCDLNNAGQRLPSYLAHDSLSENLAFLADLARLEWAVRCAFHAHDTQPISATAFAAWNMNDWERAVFSFQPSAAVVSSPWPIYTLWQSRDDDRTAIDIDLRDRPQAVLVYRRGYDVDCKMIAAAQRRAFEILQAGTTLAEASAALAEAEHAATDITQIFGDWMRMGLIASAHLADP